MTEGMEDFYAGPAPPPGSSSPTSSTVDTGQVPEEKPEETEAVGERGEEDAEETAEGGGDGDGEHVGASGIVALPGTCCVCIEMEQINKCLHSEKICILPILACLLSLALCTAGLKWVFVDKIFEYEPPTHLDPKPIGQDPIIISVDPRLEITVSIPHLAPSTVSLSTTIAITPGHPEVLVEEKFTQGPYVPQSPREMEPSATLKYNAEHPTVPKQTAHPQTAQELNNIIPTISTTSTSTAVKTSSHVTRCSDSQRNYCVNGGECFTLEIMPGSTKFLCRCPNEFTGDRCQNYVMASFYTEELYQKRILTITGICIALLVVGLMCVVAYCKTKKQRKKLRDRLRQSLKNKRNNNTKADIGSNLARSTRGCQSSNLPLQDLKLVNQCNGMNMQHAAEETETTISSSKYALCAHEPTELTHISSQRFASAMTNLIRLSPECGTSPITPGSPPSEMSPPLSSLAISVPSVALSPSGEEKRPLLLSGIGHQQRLTSQDEQKRTSFHYNHGHVAHSLPPSPLLSVENVNYQTGDDNTTALMFSASSGIITNINKNISDYSMKRITGHMLHYMESSGDSMLVSETEEPQGEQTHFLSTESTTTPLLKAMDSNRTNPASPLDGLQVMSSYPTIKQDPIAV
ncbi:pro-neuregulin-1, membrane-bound isoform isoform X2 [Acanthochromis polyacanthus]|uniref:pro-neuregulin-1, membrane-bound isoform isoform X2 n=1 Tax=Acanthochromis polyacanthus TaxID=80966 RepID=UPI000B909621|nr:pro-neuregulin-1, membrane-bound isoform isoform X2 [Acanthochromis polyacanthus]